MKPKPMKAPKHLVPVLPLPDHHKNVANAAIERQGAVQNHLAAPRMPAAQLNFNGTSFPGGNCFCAPPDTNGMVGTTQYVQIVNTAIQVFDKSTGNSVLGPINIETLWSGFGGPCETFGEGDPVVLFDRLANRWVITQFASFPPTVECVAVSTSDDATGSYNRYAFDLGSQFGVNFYDYPKLGTWPDAYYMSMNVYDPSGSTFLGPMPFAMDRTAMLAGLPATIISTGMLGPNDNQLMPADVDGSIPPPAGAPNPFTEIGSNASAWAVWRFHVDFANPSNSTFTNAGSLTPGPFTVLCPNTRSCVPQAGTSDGLDAIGDRSMFRNAYRRFPDGHEALVGNMTVDSNGVAGIRWWEINNATSGTPSFVQQSTYQPDNTWRWMGSAAMDASGDMAIGFSASSSSINPQIRYAGRLAGDPPNTLAQGEATLFAGTGSQTDTDGRWGDYSGLSIDPTDDCTFWYTNEYYTTTSSFNWNTRIGDFKFPSCTKGPAGTLSGTVTDASTNQPIAGAQVNTSLGSTITDANGNYKLTLPVGTYDVTYAKFGYATNTQSGVSITDGNSTTVNVALQPSPSVTVSGTVTDGSGHGWPLYTRIDVAGDPNGPFFTDPITGQYSIQLPANASYDVTFSSQLSGYQLVQQTIAVGGGAMTQNVTIPVTPDCSAPGYSQGTPCVVIPGGLVEGNVSDLTTGNALNNATVQSNDNPADKATTFAVPADPKNPGGFYYLFSSLTGSHPFTASASQHSNVTETVNVAGNSTVRQDFKLGAGHLVITPTSISSTQVLGTTTTQTLSFQNTGNGAAHVQLNEQSGSFQILSEEGSPLHTVQLQNKASPAQNGAHANAAPVNAGPPAQPTWSQIANYPISVMDNSADFLSGKEYSVGGLDGNFNLQNSGYVYDPSQNTWTQIANMPVGRQKPGVVALNGKLYVTGGWDVNGTPIAETDVYDPASNTWSTVAPNPSPTAAPGVATANGKIYFIGGCADAFCTPSSNVEVYDPASNSWSSAANYPTPNSWEGCGGISGKVYCAGGTNNGTSLTSANVYDPTSDSWSPIANLPIDLWGGVAGAPSGTLVLSSGVTNQGFTITNQGFSYDPSSNTWSAIPNAQFPVYRAGGGCGYYKIGGSTGGFAPSANSELLSGLTQCGFTDVPWLDENPSTFDVPTGGTVNVTITLSATTADQVTQPGTYTAQLVVTSNTPQTFNPMDVTMNVTPPKSWGKIDGVVSGQNCTNKTSPLRAVVFADGKGYHFTLPTDKNGNYAFWAPAGASPFTMTASANGWIPQTTKANIRGGKTTTVNFTLRPTFC
jgi:N-acetylneuraminic acid mutarotase